MRKNRWISLVAISLAVSLAACGGDDDDDDDDVITPDAAEGTPDAADTPDADPNQPDAPPAAACDEPALAPLDDGTELPTGGIPDLIISEINPGDYIEVYNTTDGDIDLTTTPHSSYMFCSAQGTLVYRALTGATLVPAKGYAVLDWPTGFINATDSSGEITLYKSGPYDNANNQLDYTCWGGSGGARKGLAEQSGKWGPGGGTTEACIGAITNGTLQRLAGNDGDEASDYDPEATPTPETCTTLK